MRMLGDRASLQTFRWDLLYLLAQLMADKRPGVSALAAPVQGAINKIATERASVEQAEDQVVIANALVSKGDRRRDDVLLQLGGTARAVDKGVYETLFGKMSPSATSRLRLDEESMAIRRILGEIAKLPADHPLRTAYETALTEAEAMMTDAFEQNDAAITALALQRSQAARLKAELDSRRLETHGQLTALLKDKAEADSFFRPTSSAPEEVLPDKASPDNAAPPAPPA